MKILPLLLAALALAVSARAADPDRGAWVAAAAAKPPMTAEETRAFMKRLAQYVLDHHMKRDEASPQRGFIYEYYRPAKDAQVGSWIQGEALDSMHDGAWFALAMANAARATGDPFYREILTHWQLPFYLRMLNHGDELFSSEKNDARAGSDKSWLISKEWMLQGRERGFVPYWWDDGASQSLEMIVHKDETLNFPGTNVLAGQPNPEYRLSGYSHGSSNHLAQDLAVMLQGTWLLFRETQDPAGQQLAREIAEGARNLQECRTRHGNPGIPACVAAAGLANHEAALLKKIPTETWAGLAKIRNHYLDALVHFRPGQETGAPAFTDDQEYRYYSQLGREGTFSEPAAWRMAYDALTEPQLYRLYSDDAPVPPGISAPDLHPYKFIDGKPVDLRSQRKGPGGRPRPIGSRFGPQNMICCGWALQALAAHPGLWEKGLQEAGADALGLPLLDHLNADAPAGFWKTSDGVEAWLRRELGGGLRSWEAIFDEYGYLPTGIGAGGSGDGCSWDEFSDTGAYAHLIGAAVQWLYLLEKKRDWEQLHLPAAE